ncbi:MAG: small GTP-binding protein [Saprospiraceae bacterium]|jgi:small GTP-binding protein
MISKKVIITGRFGVGKTSLFNRFLYSKFDEKYLTTIGVKVDKKVISIEGQELNLLVWDIAGEISQDKVPHSYFLGTSGVIYVFDLTRPITVKNLETELKYLRKIAPGISIKVIGNKKDLVSEQDIEDFVKTTNISFDFLTSAKTGDNIEELFFSLGKDLMSDVLSQTI